MPVAALPWLALGELAQLLLIALLLIDLIVVRTMLRNLQTQIRIDAEAKPRTPSPLTLAHSRDPDIKSRLEFGNDFGSKEEPKQ